MPLDAPVTIAALCAHGAVSHHNAAPGDPIAPRAVARSRPACAPRAAPRLLARASRSSRSRRSRGRAARSPAAATRRRTRTPATTRPPRADRPATRPTSADFPKAKGKLAGRAARGPAGRRRARARASRSSTAGKNRYGFALFDAARKQIAGRPVALYVSKTDGTGVRGPFVARSESLAVKPAVRGDLDAEGPRRRQERLRRRRHVPAGPGKYRVSAIAELDGRLVSTSSFGANVHAGGTRASRPRVGDAAPKVHTPTLDDVAGDAERISTRNPPAEDLLKTDLADVYGKKPVLLLFATPALCASRVCGPVVDVLEQARSQYGKDDVAFIHNEIYSENRVDQGLRPEPAAFRLPTEPWLFVIDRDGRVVERIEGAFSVAEAEKALEKAQGRLSTAAVAPPPAVTGRAACDDRAPRGPVAQLVRAADS